MMTGRLGFGTSYVLGNALDAACSPVRVPVIEPCGRCSAAALRNRGCRSTGYIKQPPCAILETPTLRACCRPRDASARSATASRSTHSPVLAERLCRLTDPPCPTRSSLSLLRRCGRSSFSEVASSACWAPTSSRRLPRWRSSPARSGGLRRVAPGARLRWSSGSAI